MKDQLMALMTALVQQKNKLVLTLVKQIKIFVLSLYDNGDEIYLYVNKADLQI